METLGVAEGGGGGGGGDAILDWGVLCELQRCISSELCR